MDNITTIGIDVAKNFLDICIMPSGEILHIPNTEEGFKKLLKSLKRHKEIFRIVLEHTGGYQKYVVKFLQEHNFPVSVVNPSRVKFFAKASGQKAKTDAIDAENLALFGLVHKPEITEVADEGAVVFRQLVHRRLQLVRTMVSEKNRLEKEPCLEVKKSVERLLEFLENELALLTGQINELIEKDEVLRRKSELMQTVKGIGKTSSAMLLSELPEMGRIGRQQIASMAGLAPMNRDSGNKKGRAFIHAGRKYVRLSLYMPIITAIQHNPVLRAHYNNLISRGKPKKVALTACMRKMLVHLNSLLAKEFYAKEKKEKKLTFCLT